MLCKVVRECNTVSCSGDKNIILSLYDAYSFIFTYIKTHFISKNASIFSKHSLFFISSILDQAGPMSTPPLAYED